MQSLVSLLENKTSDKLEDFVKKIPFVEGGIGGDHENGYIIGLKQAPVTMNIKDETLYIENLLFEPAYGSFRVEAQEEDGSSHFLIGGITLDDSGVKKLRKVLSDLIVPE